MTRFWRRSSILNSANRNSGVTLLEILMAVAVLGIISLAVTSIMTSASREASNASVQAAVDSLSNLIYRSVFDSRTLYWSADDSSAIPASPTNESLRNCMLSDSTVCPAAATTFGAILVRFMELKDTTYPSERIVGYGLTKAAGNNNLRVLYSRDGALCAVGSSPSRECPIEATVELACADETGCGTNETAGALKVTVTIDMAWTGEGVPNLKARKRTGIVQLNGPPKYSLAADDCRLNPKIAAGTAHACGILSTGALRCWGTSTHYGGSADIAGSYSQVVAGSDFICAIKTADETVSCFGLNGSGQTTAPSGRFRQLAASWASVCGIKYDDSIVCWGDIAGVLPATLSGKFRAIAIGVSSGAGASRKLYTINRDWSITRWTSAGAVDATYSGTYRQINGNSLSIGAVMNTGKISCTSAIGTGADFTTTTASACPETYRAGFHTRLAKSGGTVQTHSCAIMDSADVECWGVNTNNEAPATRAAGSAAYNQLAVGNLFSCSIDTSGTAACWGSNGAGQSTAAGGTYAQCTKYGETTLTDAGASSYPGTLADARTPDVQAGEHDTCLLHFGGGRITCWRSNFNPIDPEILGITTPAIPMREYEITVASYYDQLELGKLSACARRASDQSVRCWGKGPLGEGTTTASATPVEVSIGGVALKPVAAVTLADGAAGSGCVVMNTADREVYCWNSTTTTPTLITGVSQVVGAIGTDSVHLFLMNTGEVKSVAVADLSVTTLSGTASGNSIGIARYNTTNWAAIDGNGNSGIAYYGAGPGLGLYSFGTNVTDLRTNLVPGTNIASVCTLLSDGAVRCTSIDGSSAVVDVPIPVPTNAASLKANEPAKSTACRRTCVLKGFHQVYCFPDGTACPLAYWPYATGKLRQEYPVRDACDMYNGLGDWWVHEAYLKAPNAEAGDLFGSSVFISADTAVVGAPLEDSIQATITNATAVVDNDNSPESGAAYVYFRSGSTWSHQSYLKAPNTGLTTPSVIADLFGNSVAVSGDRIVVGAFSEDSDQTVITNNSTMPDSDGANDAGAAYVFVRAGANWSHEAYLKAPNAEPADMFGTSVSISGDYVVVGSPYEDSNDTSITNAATITDNDAAAASGAAYVFFRDTGNWVHQSYLKAPNSADSDYFGSAVAISGDTAVVGAPFEDSNQTSITNDTTASADDSAQQAGAVYVFKRTGTNWAQEAYLKPANSEAYDQFGAAVAIDGNLVVVGSAAEDSSQTSITNGATISDDDAAPEAGAAYVFSRSGATWTQQAYLKAWNTNQNDLFGISVGVDGTRVVVGAMMEASNQTSVTNCSTASADNGADHSGAAYVFKQTGANWAETAYLKAPNAESGDLFGTSVSIDGDTIVVGASYEDSNQVTVTNATTVVDDDSAVNSGAAYVFHRITPTPLDYDAWNNDPTSNPAAPFTCNCIKCGDGSSPNGAPGAEDDLVFTTGGAPAQCGRDVEATLTATSKTSVKCECKILGGINTVVGTFTSDSPFTSTTFTGNAGYSDNANLDTAAAAAFSPLGSLTDQECQKACKSLFSCSEKLPMGGGSKYNYQTRKETGTKFYKLPGCDVYPILYEYRDYCFFKNAPCPCLCDGPGNGTYALNPTLAPPGGSSLPTEPSSCPADEAACKVACAGLAVTNPDGQMGGCTSQTTLTCEGLFGVNPTPAFQVPRPNPLRTCTISYTSAPPSLGDCVISTGVVAPTPTPSLTTTTIYDERHAEACRARCSKYSGYNQATFYESCFGL